MKTKPAVQRTYVFAPCRNGEHEDCRGTMTVEDPNDLSKPRERHSCACKCHKKVVNPNVQVEVRMLLGGCNAGQHSRCFKRVQDAKDSNKVYICNCRCHRNETSVPDEG